MSFQKGQGIKPDALWKPLLLSFRSYLRRILKKHMSMNFDYGGSTSDLSEYAQQACRSFIAGLGAHDVVQNNKLNYYGLLILMAPCATSGLDDYFGCVPKLKRELQRLRALFSKIFKVSNRRSRVNFFSHQLIRLLWIKFRQE